MDQVSSEVLRQLASTGRLRAAINLGNPVLAQRPATVGGDPTGATVDLARELGRRLQAPVRLIPFEAAGKVFESARSDVWDVAFLAIDPARADDILFTPPYVIIEATCLVRAELPFRSIDELDRPGLRIAVGRGAAYELYLSRTIRQAELVRSDTSHGAIELFREQGLEAVAGVRQPLLDYARGHAGCRVLDGRLTAIEQAMGAPKGHSAARDYLRWFIEEMKASGFVAEALARSGQRDAAVAPPADWCDSKARF